MTADEIRTMEPNTALIISGSNRAIYTKMYPYFNNAKYRDFTKLPLPLISSKLPFDSIPIISLPEKPKPANDKENRK